MYSYDEVFKASTEYFGGDELPAKVFTDKYSLKDVDGNFLEKTPDDTHRRLAREFARIEKNKFKNPYSEDFIFSLFKDFATLIPQGSPIFGIGNHQQYVSISNCFVIDGPDDSYGSLLKADEEIVQISKRRGGVGVDLSKPRPSKTITHNSSNTSTGTTSWMERYSNSIREVGQDGRRGALMESISIHHPDVLEFATIKNNDTKVTGANISIRLSDEFLNAVINNTTYEQRWSSSKNSKIPKIRKEVNAKSVWDTIIHSAWLRAEPGLLFWDNIIKESPADCYETFGFRTICTNPCGEIPLSAYDSCRLFAINLMSFVVNPFTPQAYFNFAAFYALAQIAQRLMDDMVDIEVECIDKILSKIEQDPEDEEVKDREKKLWQKIRHACVTGRRTGLGITALGDTLAALGLHYGSADSILTVERIYKTLKFGSYRSSVDMAKELGAFPCWNWELEKDNPFLNRLEDEYIDLTLPNNNQDIYNAICPIFGKDIIADIKKYGRRNIANLTTAPTGSISILASYVVNGRRYFNTTSGVEPCTYISYTRSKKGNISDKSFRVDFTDKSGDTWMFFPVFHNGVLAWHSVNPDKKIEDSPYHGYSSNDIDWVERVKLQATAQKHVDHAISSTINLPSDVKEEKVGEIYLTAWKAGCKGITVYRDGCRTGVINNNQKEEQTKRPRAIDCDVHHITVKGKSYFVLVGKKDDKLYEVFAGKNGFLDHKIKHGQIIKVKKGYKAIFDDETELTPITSMCDEHEEAITRLVSTSLRYGADINTIVEQLEKVNGDVSGFAKSISRALKKYIKDGTQTSEKCQECNTTLIRSEGCKKCPSCGWSKC